MSDDMMVKIEPDEVVTIPDDGIKPAAEPKVEAKAEPKSVPPAAGIEELQKQLENAKRHRDLLAQQGRQVQAERDRAIAWAQEAERRGVSAQEVAIEQKIAAAQQQMQALGEAQIAANEAGEWRKAAEINQQLAMIGGEITMHQRDRATLAWQREQVAAQAMQRQQMPRPPTDPLEAALQGRTPATQAFIRRHPDIVRQDGTFKAAAVAAHEQALDEGLAVDTDAYFKRVEGLLGTKKEQPPAAEATRAPRNAPTEAAPVSRASVNSVPGFDGENLHMTPAMMQRAIEQMGSDKPQDIADWAKAYVRGVRSGAMTPITD